MYLCMYACINIYVCIHMYVCVPAGIWARAICAHPTIFDRHLLVTARSLGRCKLISNHYKDYGLKNYGLHMYADICVYISKVYIILHINHHLFQIFVYIYNIIDTGVYIYIYVWIYTIFMDYGLRNGLRIAPDWPRKTDCRITDCNTSCFNLELPRFHGYDLVSVP